MRALVLGRAVAALVFAASLGAAWPGGTYTQSVGTSAGNVVPMGHEWITRLAAVEVLGVSPVRPPDEADPKDPRRSWSIGRGRAWNPAINTPGAQAEANRIRSLKTDENRYASRYTPVYDAIIGERWVDLAGYNAVTAKSCWDAVAQEPAEIQYDHFMRRYDDAGGAGGVNAASRAQERFINYFVAAATAPKTRIAVYDGGAIGSASVSVDNNYFLFGRAVHLFQDSFSSEHTVRIPADNYIKVRQVKSYACALGSEQHSHSDWAVVVSYASGDVVWNDPVDGRFNPTWTSYKPSNMKPTALVATEASKDLWAAFIRTMGLPASARAKAARDEAQVLVNHWLSYNEPEMLAWYDDESHRDDTYVLASGQTGRGKTQTECMAALKVGTTDQMTHIRALEKKQRQCLYNAQPWAGYSDQFDPQTRIWYSWRWRNGPLNPMSEPPADWQIPTFPADAGVRVRLKSLANQKYMVAPDGVGQNAAIYTRDGTPLEFVMVGPPNKAVFRSAADPTLFLDYWVAGGAMKLFNYGGLTDPPDYDLKPAGQGRSMRSNYWTSSHVWVNGDRPYLNSGGNPNNRNTQWTIEGLP